MRCQHAVVPHQVRSKPRRQRRQLPNQLLEGDADELYDLQNEPHEIHNLASDQEYKDIVYEHHLLNWLVETEDAITR